jgi:7,8-dihydropterin-6-yl-methyl-4-(beta-D-ribofuranosyl)aminobenzene 5'-phosphate synthase
MKRLKLFIVFLSVIFLTGVKNSFCEGNRFIIVYNNMESKEELESDWGYAAWVELDGQVYLFDSGAKGNVLISNLKKLNLDPTRINQVIISHLHGDHLGGLPAISQKLKPNTNVYLPEKIDSDLIEQMKNLDFLVQEDFNKIGNKIWITKVFENSSNGIKEHALVIEKGDKYIIITGCAHPGIKEMCKEILAHFQGKTPELVTGGFHLISTEESEVSEISKSLKCLGIEKISPSHCTGEKAIEIFSKDWGNNYIQLFLGDEYSF